MVSLIQTTQALKEQRQKEQGPIAFVPTMGNLHAGHISLLEEALKEFKTVYFSIFVNPKQFGPNEDYDSYPRTLESDLIQIQASAQKFPDANILVYSPRDPKEVFPENLENRVFSVGNLGKILEGEFRPSHFDGVATVVYRLFELIKPQKAYFGLKDYQQYIVIKQLVKDLMIPTQIVGMPIIRESSGLALSSRNQYLSSSEKDHALILNQSLQKLKNTIGGDRRNLSRAYSLIKELVQDLNWNYLEIRDAETLSADVTHSNKVTLLGVYQLGQTRLLDSLQLELP